MQPLAQRADLDGRACVRERLRDLVELVGRERTGAAQEAAGAEVLGAVEQDRPRRGAVASCAASVREKEDMLAAAGFRLRPADTPQRVAALTALPPHRFVRRTVDGRVTYLYADPTVCRCLYVGGQEAYGTRVAGTWDQEVARVLEEERVGYRV